MYTHVLFDLDGTLTDSRVGITESVRQALLTEGFDAPSAETLGWVLGPPLRQSFAKLANTTDQAMIDRLLVRYRERFEPIGMFENKVYDGIPELLQTLKRRGHHLYVATSKPHVYAAKILDHFDLKAPFDGVFGAELDGSVDSKADVIRVLLREMGISPSSSVMVGDREHDVIGASAHGIATIGVTYGFGSETELRAAGAAFLAHTPQDIAHLVSQ